MTQAEGLIGKQIDQYRVESHIASGGMASVYLAQDTQLQRPVALKVMLSEMARQSELVARFYREGKVVARLDHPNIVNVYTIGAVPGANQPYLAMQYVDGGSLLERLKRLAQRGGQIAPAEVLALLYPIAEALRVAHGAGIVHRDLKPSNILLRKDGAPLLTDLGIAAVKTETTRLTHTGMVLGTPHYMSPEQAGGKGEVDGRSDIYSLGVILYEMLAGEVPFDGDNSLAILHQHLYEPPPPLNEIRPGLAQATYHLVNVCLCKDPAERFADAAQLAAAIREALAVERGERTDTPLPAHPQPEEGERRRVAAAQRHSFANGSGDGHPYTGAAAPLLTPAGRCPAQWHYRFYLLHRWRRRHLQRPGRRWDRRPAHRCPGHRFLRFFFSGDGAYLFFQPT